jgi:hypothetical protein
VTSDLLLRDQAWAYTQREWSVLPLWWPDANGKCACNRAGCDSVGKHPIRELVPHGLHDATTDLAQVNAWWHSHPRANLGIRTGAESGLVVLDIDGGVGRDSVRELVDRHERFPALWVRTGSGGWHAYMAHPGETVPNSAGRLGEGLDIRGDGGYVVAPPSQHVSGDRYRWVDNLNSEVALRERDQLPPTPGWLLELARPPAQPAADLQPVRVQEGHLSSYAAAAVRGEADEVAVTPPGGRNHRLNAAAFRLGRLVGASVLDERTAMDALASAAASAGLPEHEAQATIRSGLKAGAAHPRHVEPASPAPARSPNESSAARPGMQAEAS